MSAGRPRINPEGAGGRRLPVVLTAEADRQLRAIKAALGTTTDAGTPKRLIAEAHAWLCDPEP